MEKLGEIGSTVYELGLDTWVQYYAAVIAVAALAGGITIGAMGRENILRVAQSYRNTASNLLLWVIQRGNIVARRRRKKYLMGLAEDFLTDGFEDLYAAGKITEQEKLMVYRRLGISLSLSGLLPVKDPAKLKENIKKRLRIGLHTPVPLPETSAVEEPKVNTMLTRLQARMKSAC